MATDTEKEFEKICLSYNKILRKLKLQNIKTKNGKDITNMDLKQAILIMDRKHHSCRWKVKKIGSKRHYILIEGYYWLIYVYFQYDKKQIDADVDFFEKRIKQYEELLEVIPKRLFTEDMYIDQLPEFFNRKKGTIKNNIIKIKKYTNQNYIYYENDKRKISKEGIEWLCKNCFKQKYLDLLEEYKMELTEIYIHKGYPYDKNLGFYDN